jgi:RNA polymerase sigma-70 factor, ECF subfamily
MTSTADEVWFRDAFEEYRHSLHAHCYRLAGNVADADDLVQETFLRGWRSRTQYEGRASM